VASELSRLLSGFRARKLVVVGDLVADHYVYGQTDRVSREAPVRRRTRGRWVPR
jgi:bifunctional ADP-heptose synthase (sugar kinase/adenylyltransferase)